MNIFKRSVLLFMIAVVLSLPMITHAEGIDLKSYAVSNLTEVLGYTAEEAAQFVFDETDEGKIAFWHPDHPDWVYTLYIDKRTGEMVGTTPFDTGYELFRGENAVRGLLQTIREKGYFANWNPDNRQELIGLLNSYEIWISTELYFTDDGGKAVHGFFESCYGPDFAWPEQLCQVYQSILEEYHLTREQEPFHQLGIRKSVHPQTIGAVRTVILFEGEIPDDLKSVLNNSHLNGWQCSSGAVILQDWSQCTTLNSKENTGSGLVAFEKDNHRQLVQLYLEDDGWRIVPLGENALLQTGEYRVTFDGIHNSIAVEYILNENERSAFYLTPAVNGSTCTIKAYERLDWSSGEAVWIACFGAGMPTWNSELFYDGWKYPKARFPQQLGIVPIDLFPVTVKQARENSFPGLPDDCVLVNGVNFRTQTTSRSRSYGELKPGVMIRVLDVIPGDPNDWIHTRIGALEGYVVSSYTSRTDYFDLYVSQPVAKAEKEITLKSGTGWFDSTVGTFPTGTRMHVVMEDGDWLYVDIPRGEMNWLMDPEGTFGYVHKNDVVQASTICQLDWMDE